MVDNLLNRLSATIMVWSKNAFILISKPEWCSNLCISGEERETFERRLASIILVQPVPVNRMANTADRFISLETRVTTDHCWKGFLFHDLYHGYNRWLRRCARMLLPSQRTSTVTTTSIWGLALSILAVTSQSTFWSCRKWNRNSSVYSLFMGHSLVFLFLELRRRTVRSNGTNERESISYGWTWHDLQLWAE